MKCDSRKERRVLRHRRIRARVCGTADRPRMAIMVSNKHIHVQFIDDDNGVTIVSVSTKGHEDKKNVESAFLVGSRAVKAALEKGIKKTVVDRGGFRFTGRVKAVVDAAVKAGLVAGAVTEEK